MGLFGNNKDVVAIDIGSNSIKMVQLSKNGPQYSLVRWGKEELASETIVDGSIMNTGEIIDVIKCSNFRELEKDLHREYKECRIPQTEYFRLDENQLIEVSKKFKLWAK